MLKNNWNLPVVSFQIAACIWLHVCLLENRNKELQIISQTLFLYAFSEGFYNTHLCQHELTMKIYFAILDIIHEKTR